MITGGAIKIIGTVEYETIILPLLEQIMDRT